jgi:DNA-binding XRE family transcriptional regulator
MMQVIDARQVHATRLPICTNIRIVTSGNLVSHRACQQARYGSTVLVRGQVALLTNKEVKDVSRFRFNSAKFFDAAKAQSDRTGYAIAQRTGLAEGTISRILTDRRQPKFETAALLARTYGQKLDDLVLSDVAA